MDSKFFILLTVCSVCFFSCIHKPGVNPDRVGASLVFSVSQANAIEVAQRFCSKKFDRVSVKTDVPSGDTFVPLLDGEHPYAFIVNFSEGGCAIISADRRMNPVLAYSDSGSITDDTSKYPVGFLLWLNDIKADFKSIQEGTYDKESALQNSLMWNKLLTRIDSKSVPVDTSLIDLIDTTVGPLLSTTWYELQPFNNNLPQVYDTVNHTFPHCAAGSSTVAIARLMHYHRFPTTFNWNDMPLSIPYNDSTNYTSLFDFYYDVFSETDSFKGLVTYVDFTRVKEVFHVDSFLKNRYGYSSATQINYNRLVDYNIVESELLGHSRPVILSGSRTNGYQTYWICDGVHKYRELVYDNNGQPAVNGYLYFHQSWMSYFFPPLWLGFSSFTAGTLGSSTYSYTNSMRLVYQIIP